MLAEILTIGDELCRGEIVDKNSAYLAGELWDLDITCTRLTSCRDVAGEIAAALEAACGRADLVLCSGGLGPTEDDLTVDVVADLVGQPPVEHTPSRTKMEAKLAQIGAAYPLSNLRQVRVPGGATPYINPVGQAPGFEVELHQVPIICLPGPPPELKGIFESWVRDRLVALRNLSPGREHVARELYRVFGRGESQVAAALDGLLDGVAGATLHYQATFPETLVKVVVRDRDPAAAKARLAAADQALRSRLGSWLYGTGHDGLAHALGQALSARGLTLATAESCTGGALGARITQIPGASAYYIGGAVVYSNQEKVRQLGVSQATLDQHGAVSEETVLEMASGMRERSGADIAVAVSGIAGPGGGTEDKPVGTVHVAVDGPGGYRKTRRFLWPGTRGQIQILAVFWAMSMVRRAMEETRP